MKCYSPGRHWWLKYVCCFRDNFKSTALYQQEGDEDGASVVYFLLFAKQNPYVAVFLELRQVAEDDAVHGYFLRGVFLPRNRRVYSKANLVHFVGDGLPFSEEDDIFVLRDLRFECGFLISDHAPQRFELFVAPPGTPASSRPAAEKPTVQKQRVAAGIRAQLLHDFPWLAELEHCMVEMEVCMVMGLAPQAILSLILLRGAMAMMVLTLMERLWWRSWQLFEKKPTTPRMRSGIFTVAYLGGTWTAAHKLAPSDVVAGLARAGLAKDWCHISKWPKQLAFYYNKCGLFNAHVLAREWTNRSLFTMWLSSTDDDFHYTESI